MKIPYGKRIKSSEDLRMFERFPNSETVKTLPAGKPSQKIKGYTMASGGFYAVNDGEGPNLYIKDSEKLNFVPATATDESSILNSWIEWGADIVGNTKRTVEKKAGFWEKGLQQGWNESLKDLTGFGGDLRKILLAGAALFVVAIIIMLINTLRG